MTRHVAFLRGITLTNAKMPDLARCFEHAGFTNVRTILGSGTVSNADRSRGISCLAERRMIETIETGKPQTPFMAIGDRIEIEAFDAAGQSPFGKIDQRVVEGKR